MRNVFLIVLSLFMTSTVVFSGFRLYRRALVNAVYDLHYQLHTVIQTGPEKEALPTLYLMELLELSMDKPQNYVTFDEKVAEKKILQSPVIRSARVKKRKPDTVYVDYEVYKPVALWKDKTNMALSEEGHPFPIRPIFPVKWSLSQNRFLAMFVRCNVGQWN